MDKLLILCYNLKEYNAEVTGVQRAGRGIRRGIALFLSLCLFALPTLALAAVQNGGTLSGTVRVYLSSLSSYSSLDITVAGSYTIGTDSAKALTRGEKITVSASGSTLYMTRGGTKQAMGSSFKLRRHVTSGENGVRISQARNSANLYPGDIEFRVRGGQVQAIVHVYIEDYLLGVVPYEMSNGFPLEALKAQTVAARTYTLKKMSANASDYDVVDTTTDQTYRGTPSGNANCKSAVTATSGIAGMYNGSYMASYYTASNGGQTESVQNAWSSSSYAYLTVKDDPYDLRNSASSSRSATIYKSGSMADALLSLLRTRASTKVSAMGYLSGSENVTIRSVDNVTVHTPRHGSPSALYTKVDFTVSVTATRSGGARENISAPITLTLDYFSELENLLSLSLNSTQNELISVEETSSAFKLIARRYGHGIGLSQRGAQQMANEGIGYEAILDFYYPGTTLTKFTFTRSILSAIDGTTGGEEEGAPPETGSEGDAIVTLSNPLSTLNLRKSASASSAILAQILHGTQLRVLSNDGTWCQVQYGALSGYVMRSYLTFTTGGNTPAETNAPEATHPPAAGEGTALGTCVVQVSGKLNLRAQPTTSSAILALLSANTRLTMLSTEANGWIYVRYGTVQGYVSARYVSIDASAVVTPLPTTTPVPGAPTAGPGIPSDQAIVNLASDNQTLNLRLQPTTASGVLARIRHGRAVSVLYRYQTWSYVAYAGTYGYVMNSYLYFPEGFNAPGEGTTGATPSPVPSPTPAPTQGEATENTPTPQATPSALPTAGVTAAPVETIGIVTLSSSGVKLNVRATASTRGKILGSLANGTQVKVIHRDDTWCAVEYMGTTGYVATRLLTFTTTGTTQAPPIQGVETPSPTAGTTGDVTAVEIRVSQYLNVRSKPSSGAKVIGRVKGGTTQTVTDTFSGFYEITFEGGVGYVSATYATPVAWAGQGATPVPTTAPQSTQTPPPQATTAPTAPPAQPGTNPSITGSYVNAGKTKLEAYLYDVLGDTKAALKELPRDTAVQVLGYTDRDGWLHVEVGGVYGYMLEADVSLQYAIKRMSSAQSLYNVYQSASKDAQSVATVIAAERVSLISTQGEWAHIRVEGGTQGYIGVEAIDSVD